MDGIQERQVVVPLDALNQQNPAITSLRVVSQPPNNPVLTDIVTYAYQTEPLGQARLYIVDSGVDTSSPVKYHPSTVNGHANMSHAVLSVIYYTSQ